MKIPKLSALVVCAITFTQNSLQAITVIHQDDPRCIGTQYCSAYNPDDGVTYTWVCPVAYNVTGGTIPASCYTYPPTDCGVVFGGCSINNGYFVWGADAAPVGNQKLSLVSGTYMHDLDGSWSEECASTLGTSTNWSTSHTSESSYILNSTEPCRTPTAYHWSQTTQSLGSDNTTTTISSQSSTIDGTGLVYQTCTFAAPGIEASVQDVGICAPGANTTNKYFFSTTGQDPVRTTTLGTLDAYGTVFAIQGGENTAYSDTTCVSSPDGNGGNSTQNDTSTGYEAYVFNTSQAADGFQQCDTGYWKHTVASLIGLQNSAGPVSDLPVSVGRSISTGVEVSPAISTSSDSNGSDGYEWQHTGTSSTQAERLSWVNTTGQ